MNTDVDVDVVFVAHLSSVRTLKLVQGCLSTSGVQPVAYQTNRGVSALDYCPHTSHIDISTNHSKTMQVMQVVHFYIWLQAFLFTSHGLAVLEQQLLRPQARLRNATLEDVDNIVTIIIAAFSSLPDWKYLYEFQGDFPEEHRKCGRDSIIRRFSDKSALIQVIEPLADSDMKVTAVAIWYQRAPQSYTSLYTAFSKNDQLSVLQCYLLRVEANACTET